MTEMLIDAGAAGDGSVTFAHAPARIEVPIDLRAQELG